MKPFTGFAICCVCILGRSKSPQMYSFFITLNLCDEFAIGIHNALEPSSVIFVFNPIFYVLAAAANTQMIGVHASTVMADMVKNKTAGDRAN